MNENETPKVPVKFAEPERSYTSGTPSQRRDKVNFITELYAGNTPEEAAKRTQVTMSQITRWRSIDKQFDADVEATLKHLRDTWLYAIEHNMFKQALKDEIAAGSLDFRILERLNPAYSKDPEKRAKSDQLAASSHISDWMDDPVIFEAEFREVDDGDE